MSAPDTYGLGEATPPAPAPFDAVDGLTYAGIGAGGRSLHFFTLRAGSYMRGGAGALWVHDRGSGEVREKLTTNLVTARPGPGQFFTEAHALRSASLALTALAQLGVIRCLAVCACRKAAGWCTCGVVLFSFTPCPHGAATWAAQCPECRTAWDTRTAAMEAVHRLQMDARIHPAFHRR